MRREYEIYIFVLGKNAHQILEMIGLVFVIGIQKADQVAFGVLQAEDERRELAAIALLQDFDDSVPAISFRQNFCCTVCRTIINNNHLEGGDALRKRALDRIDHKMTVIKAID
jgi:hypothetical protein